MSSSGWAVPLQQVVLFKAKVSPGLAALNDQKVRRHAIALVPGFQNELGRPGAGHDGGEGDVRALHQTGQLQGQARPGDDGVRPRLHRRLGQGGVLLHGHHQIDSHQAVSVGETAGFFDLLLQPPQVGFLGILTEVWLPIARMGRADTSHASAGGHRPGQAAQRHPHAHAPLDDRQGQLLLPNLNHIISNPI